MKTNNIKPGHIIEKLTPNVGSAVGLQSIKTATFPLSGCSELGLPISACNDTRLVGNIDNIKVALLIQK